MIFAAGLGTRLKPLTDEIPKALVKINGVTLLEIAVKKLSSQGINDIIINVHHFAEKIKEYLKEKNNFDVNVTVSDESGELLDTGGGLKKASSFFNDGKSFLVYNVDILSNIDLEALIDFHEKSNVLATLAVRQRKTSRYLLFNANNMLCGWQNEETKEIRIVRNFEKYLNVAAFSGIQVISPKIFNLITEEGKFSLVNLYLRLCENNRIIAYYHDDDKWMDVGKIENIAQACKFEN